MKQILRFSISGTIGLIITAALFIGMLSLLDTQKQSINGAETDINFSFIKNFQEPEITPPVIKTPPVQETVKQPPAAPKLTVDHTDRSEFKMPITGIQIKNSDLINTLSIPGKGGPGDFMSDNPGMVKASIAPMYPQEALVSKTEGWVKVQISVNEFGAVSNVTVLDAEPTRIFNTAAKKAVKKWKFHPKTIDGKAQPFVATQTIEFKIEQ